jgi:hypothetical protein
MLSHVAELFKSFYELRKREFPVEYIQELGRIQTLSEPDRTDSIERLNGRIFASMTELLFHEAQPKQVESSLLVLVSPKEQVQKLLDHLGKKNPYFALWVVLQAQTCEELRHTRLGAIPLAGTRARERR